MPPAACLAPIATVAPTSPAKLAGTSQIYTMKANGTDVRQLTHFDPSNEGYQPSWSPDGSQIVFSTTLQSSSNGFSLFIMDADGSNKYPMHDRPHSPIPMPGNHARWSPDGTQIAFDSCVNCQVGTNIQLFVYTFATDSVTQLTDAQYTSNSNPAWSPDGSRIAFVSDRDYVDADTMRYRTDLYIIDVEGRNSSRLTQTGNATRPAWNPTGKNIAYEWNRQENNVFLVDISAGNIMTINSGLQFSGYPMWNRDGSKLLVSGRETEKSKPEIRLLKIKDSTADILQKIELDEKAVGRDYDWYISTKN